MTSGRGNKEAEEEGQAHRDLKAIIARRDQLCSSGHAPYFRTQGGLRGECD